MKWDKNMIRVFRKDYGLTQAQLAELLGASQAIISAWETGRKKPCSMSQKFLTLLVFKDIEREIEEILSSEQKESEISKDTIKAFREELGSSQTEFARLLGRDHSTVSYWESGEKSPGKKSFLLLKKLASKEGIDLEKLDTEVKEVSLDDDAEDCESGQESSQEGCSGRETSNPQKNDGYNMGGANFTASSHKNDHQFLPDPEIQAVASGIDVLYIGFYVDVNEKVLLLLESAKEKAVQQAEEGGDTKVLIEIGDYAFTLSFGSGVYAYILNNSDLRIKVSKSKEGSHPNVYLKFNSLFILENGAEKAYNKVRSFVSSNFGEIKEEKVSRVEMYCDVAGASIYQSQKSEFVTRANKGATYDSNGKFTGFSFGKGHIRGKIYNKTIEIKGSHKEYMYEMWDVSEGEDVWRIEFEIDRKLLREFGVESFSDFKSVAGDIWRYLTEEWLSRREKEQDGITASPLALLWEVVQSVREFFGPVTGKVREKKHSCDIDGLISQMKGCFTSIGAIRLSEGLSFSKNSLRKEIDFKIDKQLAGVDGDGELSSSDISALSEIGLYQEAYRKEVELV